MNEIELFWEKSSLGFKRIARCLFSELGALGIQKAAESFALRLFKIPLLELLLKYLGLFKRDGSLKEF